MPTLSLERQAVSSVVVGVALAAIAAIVSSGAYGAGHIYFIASVQLLASMAFLGHALYLETFYPLRF